MATTAVIQTGGKQYVAKLNDIITVDKLEGKKDDTLTLEALAEFDDDKATLEVGTPVLTKKVKVQIVDQLKGDKIRVSRFRAKSRHRRVRGFRQHLTKIKVLELK